MLNLIPDANRRVSQEYTDFERSRSLLLQQSGTRCLPEVINRLISSYLNPPFLGQAFTFNRQVIPKGKSSLNYFFNLVTNECFSRAVYLEPPQERIGKMIGPRIRESTLLHVFRLNAAYLYSKYAVVSERGIINAYDGGILVSAHQMGFSRIVSATSDPFERFLFVLGRSTDDQDHFRCMVFQLQNLEETVLQMGYLSLANREEVYTLKAAPAQLNVVANASVVAVIVQRDGKSEMMMWDIETRKSVVTLINLIEIHDRRPSIPFLGPSSVHFVCINHNEDEVVFSLDFINPRP